METTATLEALLAQVMLIAARHEGRGSTTDERFNIFRILGVETAEVGTHSAFISELLNPAGSHGLGSVFLKLFAQQVGLADFEAEQATIAVEKHIGAVSLDYTQGGRIDICVYPQNGRPIFIENKIYAADQKNQLLRYHNYDKSAKLLYLTLYGSPPEGQEATLDFDPRKTQTVSYAVDVLAWLGECRKEAAGSPLVRETIAQYLNLIQQLTGQAGNKLMMEDIKCLVLQSPDHLANAKRFGDAFYKVRGEIQQELFADFRTAFHALLPLHDDRVIVKYRGYDVRFGFDTDASGYYWGFCGYDTQGKGGVCKRSEFDELAAFLRAVNGQFKRSAWWVGWINPPGFTKVESCSPEQLYQLAQPEARRELANKTAREALICVEWLQQKYGDL